MAEGYDFFDNTATGGPGRSSPLRDESSPPIFHEGKEEFRSRGLELTLGPSNFMDTSASPPLHQRHRVGDTPAFPFLQEQSSGNFASFLLPAPYTTQKSLLQSEGSNFSHLQDVSDGLVKQRSGNFMNVGDLAQSSLMNPPDSAHPPKEVTRSAGLPSRDQIWQELQKGRTALASSQNDSSSMWNRRAMSLHTTSPLIVEKDMEWRQMRRSFSNGVPTHSREQPPAGIELFFDSTLQQVGTSSQSPFLAEVEDLQKRKEEQAERRFQARKRRRISIGEKQHKKGRQIGSSLDGKSQKKCPDNRVSQGEGFTAGDEDVALDSGCILPDEPIFGRDGMRRDSDGDIQASSNEDIQRPSQDVQSGAAVRSASVRHGNGGETASFLTNQFALGIDGSISSSDLENAGPTRSLYAMSCLPIANKEHEGWKLYPAKDHGRIPRLDGEGTGAFLSSEDGCQEINGSVSDAAKEEVGFARPHPSSVSSAPGVTSSSRLPCMQSAFAAVGAASAVDFAKTNAPFPYITQNPAVGNYENEFSLQPSTILHGLFTNVINGSGMIPASSGAFLSRTTSAMGSSEGKKGGSAFLPPSKTLSNTNGYFDEPQNAGVRPDFQASLSASQFSSTSTVVSDISVGKNVLLERQHSRPLGRRLSSQSSCVVDQALSCSRPGPSGVSMSFVPSSLRLGYSSSKQEERAKPEEMSSESQLASELSVDASHSQSTDKETERSRALVDLLWVTTTGNGPQGKTINGFMYIAGGRHVRLVCCCHGKHMSPAEFVEHSGSNDLSNPERNIVVSPLPHFNHKGASTPV